MLLLCCVQRIDALITTYTVKYPYSFYSFALTLTLFVEDRYHSNQSLCGSFQNEHPKPAIEVIPKRTPKWLTKVISGLFLSLLFWTTSSTSSHPILAIGQGRRLRIPRPQQGARRRGGCPLRPPRPVARRPVQGHPLHLQFTFTGTWGCVLMGILYVIRPAVGVVEDGGGWVGGRGEGTIVQRAEVWQ